MEGCFVQCLNILEVDAIKASSSPFQIIGKIKLELRSLLSFPMSFSECFYLDFVLMLHCICSNTIGLSVFKW